MSVSVGIDLGTTFSAVAYIEPKTQLPQILPNREGNKLTPSVIQFLDDGKVIFGSEAEDAYNAGEENCVATFKREMGDDKPYCYIDGKGYTSEDLSAMLLGRLKEDAEKALGDTISDAVITVPAYFYSREREATIHAAEKAGIKVRKIIDEPNAAAMAYGLNHWRENANILVYDLGGGTFDVTLVHMGHDGALSTITTRGNHKLGGRDWDARIQDILIERFGAKTGLEISSDRELISIVNGLSEGVKKNLSAMLATKVLASFPCYGKAVVEVTRAEFDENTFDLLDRTGDLCLAILDEAGLTKENVTDILLVGGSTRMPQVSAYLQKIFNKQPLSHVNPDEAVALGAAIQSSKPNQEYTGLSIQVVDGKKKTDRSKTGLIINGPVKAEKKLAGLGMLSLCETTAHAMGVVAINDDKGCYYNEIIIPANHPRPVRAAKKFRFFTVPHSNNELAIHVLQGDSENPIDCQIPYKYVVTGIKHVKQNEKYGAVIRIQYSYDNNGVINVQARQDTDNVDLPIRKEPVPDDVHQKFGEPVVKNQEQKQSGGFFSNLFGGGSTVGGQNIAHKYKAITFSNVKWEQYDNVSYHPSGAEFNEPHIHVIAREKNIEFHGYNISNMNEGVRYTIDSQDDFEIECDINTSTISPHPGGYLEILLGIISAQLTENGGEILLDGDKIASVPSMFHLKMSLTNGGDYKVAVDGKVVGSKNKPVNQKVTIQFGFVHDEHYCELLSHAYVTDISMAQAVGGLDDNPDTDTWDD